MRLIWLDVIYLKHKRKLVDVTKRDVHVLANQTFIIFQKISQIDALLFCKQQFYNF